MNKRNRKILEAYQNAINRIDDYFEYRNESISDRSFIHAELARLTKQLELANRIKLNE